MMMNPVVATTTEPEKVEPKLNPVRVAIVGVGNCAAAFVQGLEYYHWVGDPWTTGWAKLMAQGTEEVAGLIHTKLGGYYPSDVEVVAAFDVNENKVGKDLMEAIYQPPNNAFDILNTTNKLRYMNVIVKAGPLLDGLGRTAGQADHTVFATRLRECGTNVLINWLPVGSEVASRFWADVALEAGCAFINAIPVVIAGDPEYRHRFAEAGLPLIGDDVKSQVGATILHRQLAQLCRMRGFSVDRTYNGSRTDAR